MREKTGGIHFYRGRYRVRITDADGERVPLGSFVELREAEDRLAAYLDAVENEAPLDVATWLDKWLDQRELAREIEDVDGERSRVQQYIAADPIGAMSVSGLRRADVQAWVRRMRGLKKVSRVHGKAGTRTGEPLSRQTIQNALNMLRLGLAAAVDEGKCKSNVAFDVRMKREKRTHEPWRFLDPAQQVRMLAACDRYQWPIVAFAIATGLRAGELVSLRLEDVRKLDVVVRFGSPPAEPTKGGRVKEVPQLELARQAIAAQLELLEGPAPRRVKGTWPNPHGLLFPGAQGGFRSEAHVFTWASWKQLLKDAQAPAGFRWHDLRHTCGTSLISGWWGRKWTLVEVREFLRHEHVATTERYAKLAGTSLQAAAAEANGPRNGPTPLLSQLSATNRLEKQSRFRELNSRPTVYENPAKGPGSDNLAPDGPSWGPFALAILRGMAEGDAAAVAEARGRLAAFVVSAPLRDLGGLVAALVEATRLAGSESEGQTG